jgi:hypothetical protein
MPDLSISAQTVSANTVEVTTVLDSTYLDFVSGFEGNLRNTGLAGAATTQANGALAVAADDADAAGRRDVFLLVKNAVNTVAVTAAANTAIGYLPAATKGDHLVIHIAGIFAAADDDRTATLFANESRTGEGDNLFSAGQTPAGSSTAAARATATSRRLIYTATQDATTNALGQGSKIHCYAPENNQWLVKVFPSRQGTGVSGTLTFADQG